MFHSLKMFINDNRENLCANFKPENAKKKNDICQFYLSNSVHCTSVDVDVEMENCFDFALNFHFEKVNWNLNYACTTSVC